MKYSNKIIHDVGMGISVYDIVEIGDRIIYPGDGAAHVQGNNYNWRRYSPLCMFYSLPASNGYPYRALCVIQCGSISSFSALSWEKSSTERCHPSRLMGSTVSTDYITNMRYLFLLAVLGVCFYAAPGLHSLCLTYV